MNVYVKKLSEEESKGFVYYLGKEVARNIWIEYIPDGEEFMTKRKIGTYFPDSGVYRTDREHSKHWFRKYNGWAFDAPVLSELQEEKLKKVVVYDKENELLYSIEETEFLNNIKFMRYGNHGEQIVIPKEYWTIENALEIY